MEFDKSLIEEIKTFVNNDVAKYEIHNLEDNRIIFEREFIGNVSFVHTLDEKKKPMFILIECFPRPGGGMHYIEMTRIEKVDEDYNIYGYHSNLSDRPVKVSISESKIAKNDKDAMEFYNGWLKEKYVNYCCYPGDTKPNCEYSRYYINI